MSEQKMPILDVIEKHNAYCGQELAKSLKDVEREFMPEGVRLGFCLMMFTLGEAGWMTYSSNAQRDDMQAAISEMGDKLRGHTNTDLDEDLEGLRIQTEDREQRNVVLRAMVVLRSQRAELKHVSKQYVDMKAYADRVELKNMELQAALVEMEEKVEQLEEKLREAVDVV